jgi:hypothetical protein
MTTVQQHRENIKAALKVVSDAVEAETGITYRRLIQAAERIGEESIWAINDITAVDNNLNEILNYSYHDIRQRFTPNLHRTNYTKIQENPNWNQEVYNRGLESGWALIEYYMDKKAKNRV